MSTTPHRFTIGDDVQIPAVGFGTYLIPPADTAKAVSAALAIGYRHIDTAAVYGNEQGVGSGMAAARDEAGIARDDIFVTTKLWPGIAEGKGADHTRQRVLAEFDASLNRLGLDHVDLYLIHMPLGGPKRLAQWEALVEIKRAGKARAVGVSNFSETHLDEIAQAGLPSPDANQIELHPWSQKPDLIAYMRAKRIAPIAYSSMAPLSTWRAAPGQSSGKSPAMTHETGVFAAMAGKYRVTEAQLLLRWGVQNGYAVLPKSLNPERMKQNLDLFGFAIDDDDMASIRTMDRGDGIAWQGGDPTRAT